MQEEVVIHSPLTLSGGEDGHLMIDLSKLAGVVLNGENVTVGGGAKIGYLARALDKYNRALPHGVCPYVGVGGHASGGGFGTHASRTWGLLVDRITSMQVVTAEGNIRTLSANGTDSDLFWAMRGAGPSFGIIISYTFKTFPAPPNVVIANYKFVNQSLKNAASILDLYQDFAANSVDSHWGSALNLYRGSEADTLNMVLAATYVGSQDDFERLAQPFLDNFTPGSYGLSVKSYKWLDAVKALAGSESSDPGSVQDYSDTFYAKNIMTPSSELVSTSAWNSFTSDLANQGRSSAIEWVVQIYLYGGPGSAINRPARSETAFVHRSSLLTIELYASSKGHLPPYPSSGISFINGMSSSLTDPMGSAWPHEAYQNYPDTHFTGADAQKRIWAENYARLRTIKEKYDPLNVFKLPPYIGIKPDLPPKTGPPRLLFQMS